ncbi:uncharacterized protein TNCV_549831 [Trichonephila clavipes]|nr:uncharacterized protein TNCV_549831 [Trichonephila clavipes]
MVNDAGCSALGLGLNPEEGTDVCKCIVPLRHGGTINSLRATCLLVRLVEREDRWKDPDPLQGVLPQNWRGTELNPIVTFLVLKAMANDRRTTSPLPRLISRLTYIQLLRPWPHAAQEKNEAPAGGVGERNPRLNEESAREAAHSAAETPEQSQARRQRNTEYMTPQRASEAPEQSHAQRLQQATYMASQRDTETVETAEFRKHAVAERAHQRCLIFPRNTWGVFDKVAFE